MLKRWAARVGADIDTLVRPSIVIFCFDIALLCFVTIQCCTRHNDMYGSGLTAV